LKSNRYLAGKRPRWQSSWASLFRRLVWLMEHTRLALITLASAYGFGVY